MKSLFYFAVGIILLIPVQSLGQTPRKIPYQGVARDFLGNPIANSTILLSINIESQDGILLFEENQTTQTNSLGIFQILIGDVNPLEIDWSLPNIYIHCFINMGQAGQSLDLGIEQIQTLPYALYSETVANDAFHVSQSGDTLFFWENQFIIVPGISEANFGLNYHGCTYPNACNFNPEAVVDDESCYFVGNFCEGELGFQDHVVNVNCQCVPAIYGCTDPLACNYNYFANQTDYNCVYPFSSCGWVADSPGLYDENCQCTISVWGCKQSGACNYDPLSITDNGSCIFPGTACDDGIEMTINDVYSASCECIGFTLGCTNPGACNFNPLANQDDLSCIFPNYPCDDNVEWTENDLYQLDCSCLGVIYGCMEITACNFNPQANVDDNSCLQIFQPCNDGMESTNLDFVNQECVCIGGVSGCTSLSACNYNASATIDDGSCVEVNFMCNDNNTNTNFDFYNNECECMGYITGCTQALACNYNPLATYDDGSCVLPYSACISGTSNNAYLNADCICTDFWVGCTQSNACNFDPLANYDNGTCLFAGQTCNDNNPATMVDVINPNCECVGQVLGCTNPSACNFNSLANTDDGACAGVGFLCNDGNANTTNDHYLNDCTCMGDVVVLGCMQSNACNYNVYANVDNGSCLFYGNTCDDGNPNTPNDHILSNCECHGDNPPNGNGIYTPGNGAFDYDGNYYPSVIIGNQEWLASNLKTTHYCDGTPIMEMQDNTVWSNALTPGWCYLNNDPNNNLTFGKIYNNWTLDNDSLNVCPCGWHLPSGVEWLELRSFLGGQAPAGLKMRASSTWSNNSGTNESGFSAFGGGYRLDNGTFYTFPTYSTYWWQQKGCGWYWQEMPNVSSNNSWGFQMVINNWVNWGNYIRCVKDE